MSDKLVWFIFRSGWRCKMRDPGLHNSRIAASMVHQYRQTLAAYETGRKASEVPADVATDFTRFEIKAPHLPEGSRVSIRLQPVIDGEEGDITDNLVWYEEF